VEARREYNACEDACIFTNGKPRHFEQFTIGASEPHLARSSPFFQPAFVAHQFAWLDNTEAEAAEHRRRPSRA
jgi:hypothetical protein